MKTDTHVGLSPFHFHRVFRGMVGETPLELVRRLRMERAAYRLANSEVSVTQAAFDAGYETHEAFTRAFRECFNDAPSRFRQRRRPRIELAARSGVHYVPHAGTTPFIPLDSGGRNMHVDIQNKPAMRVATVRHVGPYNQIHEAFERLGRIAAQAGLFQLAGAEMIAIYHDDPESTLVDELRSDAGIVVPDGTTLPANLDDQRIPAGRYACAVHVGPYEQLGDAWARLMGQWLPASGERIGSGVSFERYLNDPSTTPKDALRTEMCVPLAEAVTA